MNESTGPLISIVILNYNAEKFLDECISSIYKTEKRYDNDLNSKYILFNWAFPKNINSAMELADKISSRF